MQGPAIGSQNPAQHSDCIKEGAMGARVGDGLGLVQRTRQDPPGRRRGFGGTEYKGEKKEDVEKLVEATCVF